MKSESGKLQEQARTLVQAGKKVRTDMTRQGRSTGAQGLGRL
jgi:hypothetical protein